MWGVGSSREGMGGGPNRQPRSCCLACRMRAPRRSLQRHASKPNLKLKPAGSPAARRMQTSGTRSSGGTRRCTPLRSPPPPAADPAAALGPGRRESAWKGERDREGREPCWASSRGSGAVGGRVRRAAAMCRNSCGKPSPRLIRAVALALGERAVLSKCGLSELVGGCRGPDLRAADEPRRRGRAAGQGMWGSPFAASMSATGMRCGLRAPSGAAGQQGRTQPAGPPAPRKPPTAGAAPTSAAWCRRPVGPGLRAPSAKGFFCCASRRGSPVCLGQESRAGRMLSSVQVQAAHLMRPARQMASARCRLRRERCGPARLQPPPATFTGVVPSEHSSSVGGVE